MTESSLTTKGSTKEEAIEEVPPRHSVKPYFTKSKARQGQASSSRSEDASIRTPDPFYYDSSDPTEQPAGIQAPQAVRTISPKVALATTFALQARRRLQFNPLNIRQNIQTRMNPNNPANPLQIHVLPPQPLANPKVKAAKFRGKSKEDPDCHVAQFQTKWEASGYAGMYGDAVKKSQFAASLEGKAMTWYSQFGRGHFADFDALCNAFLARFRQEKTPNDVLKKLKRIKQGEMLVEDFA